MRCHPPVVKCKPLLKANATSTAMMSAVIAGLIVCFIRKKTRVQRADQNFTTANVR
jgi:hypothetical protein